MKTDSKRIAVYAVTFALMAALTRLDFVFFIPLMFISCVGDVIMVVVSGTVFGILSFLFSFTSASPIALAFIEAPYIAVFPRIIAALAAFGINNLITRFVNGDKGSYFGAMGGAAAGSICNTVLVVSLLYVYFNFINVQYQSDFTALIPIILTVSAPIELAVNIAVVPPLCVAVKKAVPGIGKFKLKREKSAETNINGDSSSDGKN